MAGRTEQSLVWWRVREGQLLSLPLRAGCVVRVALGRVWLEAPPDALCVSPPVCLRQGQSWVVERAGWWRLTGAGALEVRAEARGTGQGWLAWLRARWRRRAMVARSRPDGGHEAGWS